ncbi:hypothetical protein AWB64_00970 [Caballeronia sordidicola]|uniref:Uncharacterized protein n=1 Tax=Caballeronia sordidicola TaxID=196367 RepID=A0A158F996_CABSO|nr:hypothetical protein [Caballeronia sordidicola]SAL16364.1 hypothetical protein AWB64_00970 [Caballeronia sordidicola]
MNRNAFLAQPGVRAFVAWLSERLPTLPVRLRFAHSQFVPGGIDTQVDGIEAVLAHYHWRATWFDPRTGKPVESGDWTSTRTSLERLSAWLRESVANGDELAAGAAAREVLRWGGVRGAIPFIESKVRENAWCAYLRELAPLFALDGDQTLDELHAGNVQRFDSGLTKIHALLDTTGSPIYDSRVGAALAMLFEMFRRDARSNGNKHDALGFPSGPARGRQIRNPGELGFTASPQFYKRQVPREEWARWQLRAGWIIRAVLGQTKLFVNESASDVASHLAARCHAFEAALFMIGYDLASLADGGEASAARGVRHGRRHSKRSGNYVPTGHAFSTVLRAYREYLETSPGEHGAEDLRQWLESPAQADRYSSFRNSFRSYCYPFREPEFDLFARSPDEIRSIEEGGEKALVVANYGEEQFIECDERRQVCIVCAGLAGYCALVASSETPNERLVRKEFAGTENSANTLLSVGRGVGRHFGLLDERNRPTEFFHRFFGDGFEYFRNRLGVDRNGRDLDPR